MGQSAYTRIVAPDRIDDPGERLEPDQVVTEIKNATEAQKGTEETETQRFRRQYATATEKSSLIE